MLTGRLVPRAVALAGIAGLGLLGLTALPAVAAPHHPAAAAQGRPQWLRSNTGATHSPKVLNQLAGVHSAVINGPQAAADASTVSGAPQGIDVSSNQEKQSGGIKWSTIASDGIKFAAIKVTEGAYYTNSYALTDLPAAQAAGLTTVAYAFAIPNGGVDGSVHYSASPVVQADDLVNYLASNKLTVPPVMLDIENDPYAGSDGSTGSCYGLSQSAMVSWISGFDAEIQARTGRLPFIYTNPSWWTTCTGGSTAFSQLPVWTASWTTASTPSLPAGWRTWNLWQYTSSGTVKGIAGNVDLDQLNPNVITLLDPGAQQDPAGSALASPLPVTPFTVSPAPALTYTAAGLPPGLTIDSATGQISGTPAQTGSYQATVTATGASGTTGSVSFTWDAYGTITATQPANQSTVAGTPVSLAVQATDSAPGYSPSFTAAGLPPGLSISRSGLITGWPDSPGTYNPTIRAVDGLGSVGTATFSWSVSAAPAAGPAGAIKLKLNGKCLDDSGNQTANGTKIVIWTCNGTAPQRWTVVKDQTVRIHG
ncbi:MAG: putative Ig domain-containing protein, partial [Actinobacteria bacterium]|nr:putative Ig domain-containing protein [Actinomycetota bacterium]